MKIDKYEEMQKNFQRMKKTLNNIEKIEIREPITRSQKKAERRRRAVQKEINKLEHPKMTKIAREEQIIVKATIAIVAITFIFSGSIFAKTIAENSIEKEEKNQNAEKVLAEEVINDNTEVDQKPINFNVENNQNVIPLEEILLENVSVLKSKEYSEEIREVDFEIEYNENPNLPKGEEVITKEGIKGTAQVTVIKSFENNELVAENILESNPIDAPEKQIVDIGTSEFLANNKAHLEDTMYVTKEIQLMSEPKDNSDEICTIFKSLDVVLIELDDDDWCKVEYDGLEGFVKSKYLTSSIVTPGIIEANRIQKIKMTLSEDMLLNESTDLTLEDYKKVLKGNSQDKKNVISDNAEVFFYMDKLYNINGLFLASMAIHESAWGTSTIADSKKNLFGYGAYDSSPFESSFSFDEYSEGIELVAKVLVKYYINEEGTPIYDDETAKGSYYNGSTIADVNVRYASDTEWHNKIYKYMEYLYNRL